MFNDADINLVHQMLMSKVAEGDTAAMALFSRYIAPPPKATLGPTPFNYSQEDPINAAESVICAVSDGQLPADVGRILLDGMTGVQRIREAVELEQRLKAIEEKLGQDI
ncbi:hypothetical protein FCL40_17135 [Ferrimonas sediminicola]|uniref:Uncharacterized protein n=1 Tax=Ferrimonas sediminicola TaxID=2569538 RepID=A0A4U1B904_9GAMM|nr:hypothetical protein [Ferrimonas sediminicola]TKB46780.1 hypothetical protein FCL40_17135 [Ferrimonas sediminicola]